MTANRWAMKKPGCLWYIEDNTTQLFWDYNRPWNKDDDSWNVSQGFRFNIAHVLFLTYSYSESTTTLHQVARCSEVCMTFPSSTGRFSWSLGIAASTMIYPESSAKFRRCTSFHPRKSVGRKLSPGLSQRTRTDLTILVFLFTIRCVFEYKYHILRLLYCIACSCIVYMCLYVQANTDTYACYIYVS